MGSGAALRGDFHLVDGAGKSAVRWTLRFDFNALCDFEAETGKNALEFLEQMDAAAYPSASDMRCLFWCGLRQAHPDATLQDAGRLMGQNPTALTAALDAAMPDSSDGGGDSGGDAAGN